MLSDCSNDCRSAAVNPPNSRCQSACCCDCGSEHRPCSPLGPRSITFCIKKKDRMTDVLLAGAVYGLFREERLVYSATSDCRGILTFYSVCTGTYQLRELQPPHGYRSDLEDHLLIVRRNGTVAIDNLPLPYFCLYDLPDNGLTFYKMDSATGLPVPGAVFSLNNGLITTSDQNGLVDFGVLPQGTYSMTEVFTPEGYIPNDYINTVIVYTDGMITIDGITLDQFSLFNVRMAETQPIPFSL